MQCQAAGNRLVPQIRGSIFSAIQLLGQFIWNSLRSWAVYQPNLCSLGAHTFGKYSKNDRRNSGGTLRQKEKREERGERKKERNKEKNREIKRNREKKTEKERKVEKRREIDVQGQ